MMKAILLILIILLSWYGYKQSQDKQLYKDAQVLLKTEKMKEKVIEEQAHETEKKQVPTEQQSIQKVTIAQPNKSKFRCDGRRYCSQMHSCEEATYFIEHCSDTRMDGDNDGVPCEKQWCH